MKKLYIQILVVISMFLFGCGSKETAKIDSAELVYRDMNRNYSAEIKDEAGSLKNFETMIEGLEYEKTEDDPEALDGGGTLYINIFKEDGTYTRYQVKDQYIKLDDGKWYRLEDHYFTQFQQYYKDVMEWNET